DFTVAERKFFAADFLGSFVAFAGEQHDITAMCAGDRQIDCAPAIRFYLVATAAHAGDDVVDDGARIFAARIVAGDDHAFCQARGNAAHQRTFATVAFAAATEYADKPAAVFDLG